MDTGERFDHTQGLYIDLWSAPWRMIESWTMLWLCLAGVRRETDAEDTTAQLPVPNPHQAAQDEALFA